MKTMVVIPARYGSSRLPGKPLIKIAGQPLVLRVLKRAGKIHGVDRIILATDDSRIRDAVEENGFEAQMTPSDLASGSDRVGYVARELDCDFVVNLQGDEPLFDVAAVEQALDILQAEPELKVATIGVPLVNMSSWMNPNVVKVITDETDCALYFTRAAIPFFRGQKFTVNPHLMQHVGIYIYRRDFLLDFLNWPPSALEKCEQLEQLRILSKGYKIKVIRSEHPSHGVDTPGDVKKVEAFLKKKV